MAADNNSDRRPDFRPATLATTTDMVYEPFGRPGPYLRGGYTPTLRAIEGRTVCLSHGWIEA